MLFVIPVVINLQGHILEVYTLAQEIHGYMHTVIGVKHVYETEGVICIRKS